MKRKNLKKMTLKTMAGSFLPLDEALLKKILGGGYVSSYNINGGTITNWTYDGNNYAVYTSTDGQALVLEGVHVGSNTLWGQQSDTACYFAGEIHIGSGWSEFGYSDLLHEYGHYLQEQSMGLWEYYSQAAGSALSISRGGKRHSERPFEQDATSRGNAYGSSYYGNPYSYTDFELESDLESYSGSYSY
jgi:hypothetical protein